MLAPDRPWGFNVAGNLFAREGYPLPYEYAFNVTNDNSVLQRDRSLHTTTANHVNQTLSPRIYRLGFRLSWR